jgi:hypothetical protein
MINEPFTLSGTASSGMPVTFEVISGNATIVGDQLTLRDTNPVIVRAFQPGNSSFSPAHQDRIFTAVRAAQAISFPELRDRLTTDGVITLNATASSGLPVRYTLVSGPAVLDGNRLRLSGAPGTVTLRITQEGSATFAPAPEVTRTFAVIPVGPEVYLGTLGSDVFAAVVEKRNQGNGTVVFQIGSTGEGVVAKFKLKNDNTFTIKTRTHGTQGQARNLTIEGRLNNGVMTGIVPELGATFQATVQPQTGTTASVAGIYSAPVTGSAVGETHFVILPGGQALALSVTPGGVVSGTGEVTADGTVTIRTDDNVTINAAIDPRTSAITGTVTAAGVARPFAGISNAAERTDRLANLSSRLQVTAGDAARSVIVGFVVVGSESKEVLIRAVGPGLSAFGVQGALANPRLEVYNSAGALIAQNDDWGNDNDVRATAERVGAFGLGAGSRDSALVATLAPGAYTVVVAGVGGNGVVLVEIYDAATEAQLATQHLVNISTRGFVDTGDGNLIAGFVVSGNAPKRVLVRGVGPALTAYGVSGALADPVLRVYAQGNPNPIAQNDNWGTPQPINVAQLAATGADIAAIATSTGAFPLGEGSRDAALIISLAPGSYTAVVSGANNSTGAGLVEVYEIPDEPIE